MYAGAMIDSGSKPLTDADYRVEKMRYGKNGKDKDLSTVHYSDKITVTGTLQAASARPSYAFATLCLRAYLLRRKLLATDGW